MEEINQTIIEKEKDLRDKLNDLENSERKLRNELYNIENKHIIPDIRKYATDLSGKTIKFATDNDWSRTTRLFKVIEVSDIHRGSKLIGEDITMIECKSDKTISIKYSPTYALELVPEGYRFAKESISTIDKAEFYNTKRLIDLILE